MELKFRTRDFSKFKKYLKESNAKHIENSIEHYIYLKSGNKLTNIRDKYFFVKITKQNNFFKLRRRKIDRKNYNRIKKSEAKIILDNKRQIYKYSSTMISLNEMKVGKFVILDGTKQGVLQLAKLLKLKNPVTKPFSEL